MKRYIVWLMLLCTLLLCACSGGKTKKSAETTTTEPPASVSTTQASEQEEETTKETVRNFGALPDAYTPEQALADGCLVLTWAGSATEDPEISGIEHWDAFVLASEEGAQAAKLRVVYFQGDIYYYTDLTLSQGYYSLYTYNAFQNYETAIGSYQYMKRIEGIEPNTGNHVCYYILTDLAELTSEDVLSAARICDIESERGVPYEPIPFTQYLFLD